MHHAPHVECRFQSGNSSNSTLTRCNLFSGMPMEFHNPGFIIEVQNFINYNGLGATWGEILSAKQFFLFFTARRPSCSGCNLPTHSAVRGIPCPPLLKTRHVYLSATNKCVEQVLLGPQGKPPSMERSALKLDIYPKKSPDPRVICFAAALRYLFVFETFFPKALRRVLPENPLTLTLRHVHLDTPRH